jgi:uncharacterized protein YdeI (YjbR/CyaY-like superfamily)
MEELRVTTRRAWRNWLARHHADSDGVWFVYAKTGTGEPTVSYEESVLEALCFGWVDGLLKSMDETFYKRRFTPRKPRSTWSPSNRRRVAELVEAGLMTPAGQALVDAARENGMWDRPTESQRTKPLTEPTPEFQKALDGNPRAKAGFDGLTPGRQRTYIRWIAAAKRQATRERRIAQALDSLEEGEELGML